MNGLAACRHAQHFPEFMSALVSRFDKDRKLLQDKGSLVIKELCTLLPPEQIYREFATILETEQDAGFASTMIQTLNLIALTAKELAQLRALLAACCARC